MGKLLGYASTSPNRLTLRDVAFLSAGDEVRGVRGGVRLDVRGVA